MIRAAFAFVALLALAMPAFGQPAPKMVKGDWITLGDVAPVTGEAAGLLIGPAPPAGQTLALDPAFLISTAKGAGVILAIPLDQPVLVVRSTGNAPPARVATQARTANPAPQIGGATTTAQVLVLIRDVPRGHVIRDDDVEWADATGARARGMGEIDMVVGKEMRRALRAGAPLLSGDVKSPAVIRKGETVKIVYFTPGVRLTADGVAQNEASLGEPVRVLNTYSKRTVEAIASGAGEARINNGQ